MKELGNASAELHAGLADPILQAGVDYAILVGDEMKPLADRLAGKLALEHVANAAVATQLLKERIRPDDAILVKGSNSVGLSHLVEAMVGGDA